MRRAFLLGNPDTKRTIYLERAAQQAGLPILLPCDREGTLREDGKESYIGENLPKASGIRLLDWKDWPRCLPESNEDEIFLKIDPPLWHSSSLDELENLTRSYKERLSCLSSLAQTEQWEFLNHPGAICALLDKRECKETLIKAGLPVTESLGEDLKADVDQLLETMRKRRMYQVFLKPLNGSGAAGVAAFRWQPKTGKMALYTCAMETSDGELVNTKRLRCFTEKEQVVLLLSRILRLGCIGERWYAKAEYQDHSYDLRAVVQDDCQDFLLARLSRGPITNLHLNNHPLEASRLELPETVRESVLDLCRRAMKCFPGLRSAGIDILLEKGSLNPRIIEMNAQGDLLYQDIYQDNLIYRHQIQMIKRWLERQRQ